MTADQMAAFIGWLLIFFGLWLGVHVMRQPRLDPWPLALVAIAIVFGLIVIRFAAGD